MVVNGRTIAEEIYREIENEIIHREVKPHLTAFTCAPNFETKKYLELKKQKAKAVGIRMNVVELPKDIDTNDATQTITQAAMQTDGIVVQLPFPSHIDVDKVLASIPLRLDVDVIHYDGTNNELLPPVVGAIAEIVRRYDILLATQEVVVVGEGRLVGKPAALWSQKQGARVTVLNKESADFYARVSEADILILGAGQPGLIKPEHVKKGVIIFDAGASEDNGRLKGDADGLCADRSFLMTPVPGGIGPITVALLLKNLVTLTDKRQ